MANDTYSILFTDIVGYSDNSDPSNINFRKSKQAKHQLDSYLYYFFSEYFYKYFHDENKFNEYLYYNDTGDGFLFISKMPLINLLLFSLWLCYKIKNKKVRIALHLGRDVESTKNILTKHQKSGSDIVKCRRILDTADREQILCSKEVIECLIKNYGFNEENNTLNFNTITDKIRRSNEEENKIENPFIHEYDKIALNQELLIHFDDIGEYADKHHNGIKIFNIYLDLLVEKQKKTLGCKIKPAKLSKIYLREKDEEGGKELFDALLENMKNSREAYILGVTNENFVNQLSKFENLDNCKIHLYFASDNKIKKTPDERSDSDRKRRWEESVSKAIEEKKLLGENLKLYYYDYDLNYTYTYLKFDDNKKNKFDITLLFGINLLTGESGKEKNNYKSKPLMVVGQSDALFKTFENIHEFIVNSKECREISS